MTRRKPTGVHTLYGMRASLYAGKARAYLIKQNIDYLEIVPGTPRFLQEIVPKIGRMIIPTLETPDGEIIQDSTEIIDHFEKKGLASESAYPTTPRQLAVAHVFEIYGSEGLLRPAMHYRWNFPEVDDAFIERNFAEGWSARITARSWEPVRPDRAGCAMIRQKIEMGPARGAGG